MKITERGASSGEVFVIVAFAVYFLFMGYLGNAAGYTTHIIGSISGWQIPMVDTAGHWYNFFGQTLDVLIALINVLGWVLASLVSYVALIGFSVTGGDMPMWVTGFLFGPLALGMGWLIMSMVRGR